MTDPTGAVGLDPVMADPENAPAGEIRQQEEVQEELQKTAPPPEPAAGVSSLSGWARVALFLLAAIAFGGAFLFVEHRDLAASGAPAQIVRRLLLALALTGLVLTLHRASNLLLSGKVRSRVSRYNLRRVLRFTAAVLILGIIVSVFFANWYTTAVSLGLVSLVLGLALQAPITSFFGWVYILVRKPYRVGDRIRIGQATGDVIDVSYLDTTLWEFGGELLSTDHPSGRIIRFPNSQVFNTPVYNYSWALFPYIWNEVKFQVAYESDLEFVAKTMKEVVEEHRGPAMVDRVRVYRELLAETPVDHLQVQDGPTVLFRANDATWLDAIVRYLVDPRRAGTVKTELVRSLLVRLNAAPDRVLFPRANSR